MTEKTKHLIEEQLDVVDEKGNPTGKVVSRRKAHECGIRHRTSHVWLIRKKDGKLQEIYSKGIKALETNGSLEHFSNTL